MKYSAKKPEMEYGKSVLIGLGVTVLCVILGAMLLATFLVSGTIDEGKMDIVAAITLFVSTAIGSLSVRILKGKGSAGVILTLLACVTVLILLSNAVFFKGEFSKPLLKMGCLIAGSALALLNKKDKTKKYKKVKNS